MEFRAEYPSKQIIVKNGNLLLFYKSRLMNLSRGKYNSRNIWNKNHNTRASTTRSKQSINLSYKNSYKFEVHTLTH